MPVRLHSHATERAEERGATPAEIALTVETGARSPARHGRAAFELDFPGPWPRGPRTFDSKRVIAYAVLDGTDWLVITVIVKFQGAGP